MLNVFTSLGPAILDDNTASWRCSNVFTTSTSTTPPLKVTTQPTSNEMTHSGLVLPRLDSTSAESPSRAGIEPSRVVLAESRLVRLGESPLPTQHQLEPTRVMTLVVFLFDVVDTLMLSNIVLALIVTMLHIETWLIGAKEQETHVSVSLCHKRDFSRRRQPISCFMFVGACSQSLQAASR